MASICPFLKSLENGTIKLATGSHQLFHTSFVPSFLVRSDVLTVLLLSANFHLFLIFFPLVQRNPLPENFRFCSCLHVYAWSKKSNQIKFLILQYIKISRIVLSFLWDHSQNIDRKKYIKCIKIGKLAKMSSARNGLFPWNCFLTSDVRES